MVSFDETKNTLISLSPQLFHLKLYFDSLSDAFSISDVRLAEEIVSVRNWNIHDAGNSALGLCLLVACESR